MRLGMKTFFLAGVMQGSRLDNGIHSQDYRARLKEILNNHFDDVKIICPYEQNPASTEYDDATCKTTFLEILKQAVTADVLIAFIPEASMGTALEIWEAYNNGVEIWSVTPLVNNWVVKCFSNKLFGSIEELDNYLSLNNK